MRHLSVLGLIVVAAAVAGAQPAPFGHPCTARAGVRFCPTTDLASRIPSWDGVPLDVDVTLPGSGDGAFPTLVLLHGLGEDKTRLEADTPEGDGNVTYHYNNVFFAQRGYLVVTYSARGFGNSCGAAVPHTDGCERGWIHVADQRFEVRDTQHLVGMLVDEGLANPDAIGVAGLSYGGGQATQLALQRDAVRAPTARLVPWRSPAGRRLAIAAAWSRWGWFDIYASLLPNGRFEDTRPHSVFEETRPPGVEKQSYVGGLLLISQATGGFLPPENMDVTSDLVLWKNVLDAGEPYPSTLRAVASELRDFHGALGISRRKPAPLLFQTGFTDDLFPLSQALRAYVTLQRHRRNAPITLQVADVGQSRGQNKAATNRVLNDEGAAFLDAWLKRTGTAPAPGSVTAMTVTCPKAAPPGGPYRAGSWQGLQDATPVSFAGSTTQTVTSDGGDPAIASATDPITVQFGGSSACQGFVAADAPGTAVYTTASSGFTLMGGPLILAKVRARGRFPQLVGRLWDVDPTGMQRLVARGVYRLRPNQRGLIRFQLEGNGYRFAGGDTVRLELLGQSPPTYRPSNEPFTVELRDVQISLPRLVGSPSGAFVE